MVSSNSEAFGLVPVAFSPPLKPDVNICGEVKLEC